MLARVLNALVGLVISGLCIYLLVQVVGGNPLRELLKHRDVIPWAFATLAVAYVIRAAKTVLLLGADNLKRGLDIVLSFYASISLNNVLPLRLGDILRLSYLKSAQDIALSRSTAALLFERVVDLLVILALFGAL